MSAILISDDVLRPKTSSIVSGPPINPPCRDATEHKKYASDFEHSRKPKLACPAQFERGDSHMKNTEQHGTQPNVVFPCDGCFELAQLSPKILDTLIQNMCLAIRSRYAASAFHADVIKRPAKTGVGSIEICFCCSPIDGVLDPVFLQHVRPNINKNQCRTCVHTSAALAQHFGILR